MSFLDLELSQQKNGKCCPFHEIKCKYDLPTQTTFVLTSIDTGFEHCSGVWTPITNFALLVTFRRTYVHGFNRSGSFLPDFCFIIRLAMFNERLGKERFWIEICHRVLLITRRASN